MHPCVREARESDLDRIHQQLESRAHESDYRRHAEAADHDMIRQITRDGDETRIETDLFLGFAQRRAARPVIFGLHASSRETDLPCMVLELSGALRE